MRIPQWLLIDFPWLAGLEPWLVILQEFWHQYQNLIVLVGLYLVARRLRKERIKLSERVDTLAQIVKAARDDAEAALVQTEVAVASPQHAQTLPGSAQRVTPDDGAANWEIIRAIWQNARDRLELKIEQISRERMREKYSRIGRRRYREVITRLEGDRLIGPSVADKLRSMDALFQRLKFRPTSVTSSDVAAFRDGRDFVHKWLPSLPDEDDPPPVAGIAGVGPAAVEKAA